MSIKIEGRCMTENIDIELNQEKVNGQYGYRILKRSFDIIASAIGLVVLSPFFLAVAIAIKCDDGGPVFYDQIRIGKNGKNLKCISSVQCASMQKMKLKSCRNTAKLTVRCLK